MSVLTFDNVTVTARIGGRNIDVLRDLSFDLGAGRDHRPCRRIRCRQEHDRRGLVRACCRIISGVVGRCVVRRQEPAHRSARRSAARCSGARSPSFRRKPLSALNPVRTIGAQFGEHLQHLGIDKSRRRA